MRHHTQLRTPATPSRPESCGLPPGGCGLNCLYPCPGQRWCHRRLSGDPYSTEESPHGSPPVSEVDKWWLLLEDMTIQNIENLAAEEIGSNDIWLRKSLFLYIFTHKKITFKKVLPQIHCYRMSTCINASYKHTHILNRLTENKVRAQFHMSWCNYELRAHDWWVVVRNLSHEMDGCVEAVYLIRLESWPQVCVYVLQQYNGFLCDILRAIKHNLKETNDSVYHTSG